MQAVALASLHPDHLTVPVAALEQLLAPSNTPLTLPVSEVHKIGAEGEYELLTHHRTRSDRRCS